MAKKHEVDAAVAQLKRLATKATRDGMLRFGIPNDKALGVAVGDIRDLGKKLGRNHELALALWQTDIYEGRMLACFVDDPKLVTPAQMDAWAKDFDNWGICDTACFHLFDRTPHSFRKVKAWSKRREEFVKRAAFALLASVALHDKKAADEPFIECLPLIERAATDDRKFVKKGVSWALRGIGKRNAAMRAAAIALAVRLAQSENSAARWVGNDTLRDLNKSKKSKAQRM
jgi:3-methyladenine DNA glycosylase AlkD